MYRRPPSLRKNPEGGGTSVHRLRRSRFLALLHVIRALIVWILSHVRHVFESTTLRKNALIYIPYPRVNCLKTICFTATHTHIAHIWQYSLPPGVAVGAAVAGSAGSVGWELLAKIFRTSVPGSRGVWVMISWSAKGPRGGRGGGTPHMKGVGMLVVSLRGVNFEFWSHLRCSGQNAIIFSREGLV